MKVLYLFTLLCGFSENIQINYVKVPQALKNNSGHATILDCDYSIRPDDKDLVVKWFLNNELVYQWLPPQKPQSLGMLKDRIDLAFKATGDPMTVHRAMKILNPTTDMAGEYKCFVSTFVDEDFSVKTLIIFEPELSLNLIRSRSDGSYINFTCLAREVYPQANLIVYKNKKDNDDTELLEGVEWNTQKHPDGKFTLLQTSTIQSDQLGLGTLIFCELRIPGTGYVKRQSLLYYPDGMPKISVAFIIISGLTHVLNADTSRLFI